MNISDTELMTSDEEERHLQWQKQDALPHLSTELPQVTRKDSGERAKGTYRQVAEEVT